ncbi:hypothetical protein SCB71_14280 [Herbiconiux sp. KACC 21604]|uniref:hypothetical protein n=1 Tax=unclassified Herbiconiux TaxID=2618217 RepID=UPI001492F3DB|nr:hypothetical protein [Herbiconiux sp. SALV-R1]QJU54309.1 hypothetical protein HL652_12220 [Herbiconiux sp. SALV-R1]WPO85379.1 hypothetical protein SCB71_14280 [Herbiconiux sp. KACC 21604]
MIGTGPIRIGRDEWALIRNDPTTPAALVRRMHPGTEFEHYRVVTFDIDPAERRLIGRFRTLEAADRAVRYTVPAGRIRPALNLIPKGAWGKL